LAAVDHNPLGSAVPLQRSEDEAPGRRQIAPLTEPELNRVAVVVDGTIQVPPLASNSDRSFIDMPSSADSSLTPIEPLDQERSVVDGPTIDGGVVDSDASFGHHLLEIPQAEIVGQSPPHAEQDHRFIKMPALEHATLRPRDLRQGSGNSETNGLRVPNVDPNDGGIYARLLGPLH
jgi:hypothetical protein